MFAIRVWSIEHLYTAIFGPCILISCRNFVAKKNHLFQDIAVVSNLFAYAHSVVTDNQAAECITIIECIILNLCHALGEDESLQCIKLPEHVGVDAVIFVNRVVYAILVVNLTTGLDVGIVEVKIL